MGFEVNPCDPCAANKVVNGSQCAVVWHVDDLKVSHKGEAVVTYFAQKLGRRNKNKLKLKRGKVFDYMGMDIDFESRPGTAEARSCCDISGVEGNAASTTKSCPSTRHHQCKAAHQDSRGRGATHGRRHPDSAQATGCDERGKVGHRQTRSAATSGGAHCTSRDGCECAAARPQPEPLSPRDTSAWAWTADGCGRSKTDTYSNRADWTTAGLPIS